MRRLFLVFIAAASALPASLSPADIRAIVQKSVQATDADRRASPQFDYSETDAEPDGSKKTYAVHMLFGSPYRELTAIDGHPLPADQQQRERDNLQNEISKRRNESSEDRSKRVADFQKEQDRDRRFLEEMPKAFNFKLVGERELNHRDVYVLDAIPRPGYQPTDNASKVLTGMRGRLWIDKQTDQWVKVEAKVIHPVSIEGFLAKVEPGTQFELDKAPVSAGVWLPSHFTMSANAKILDIFHHSKHEDVTYFNYHRAAPSGPRGG